MIMATLLLACAACLIPRQRRRSAAERHLLWVASFAAASAIPFLGLYLPAWQPGWTQAMRGMLPPSLDVSSGWSPAAAADIVVRANGIDAASWSPGRIAVWVWAIGSGIALLVLAAQIVKLARLAVSARRLEHPGLSALAGGVAHTLGVTRRIRLLESSRGIVPMTWGAWRPTIILPASAAEWPDDRARAVFAHELAHIRRGDWIVHVFAEVACAVYWFNPLFRLAKNRLCAESEHAADDVVLGLGVDSDAYATHLLEIVRGSHTFVTAWSPTLAMARPSHLERRFTALLNAYANRRGATRGKAVAAVVLAMATAVPLAAMTLGRAGVRIELKNSDLPALVEPDAATPQPVRAPVLDLRIVPSGDLAGVTPPEIAEYTTPPLYSDEARARRVEGLVTIGARIDADGRLAGARVVRGLGSGLDQNALVAVRQWRFRAGLRNGVPTVLDTEIDVEFSLRNEAVNELIANDMATRVGPGVTPPRAVRIFGLWARRALREGTVVLDVVVLENGTPKIVKILQSLDPDLDEGAVRNFERWRFTPALKDGRPVKVRVNVEVHFHG